MANIGDVDEVTLRVELRIPRSLYYFILWYCTLADMEPQEFVNSMFMYALGRLFEERRGDEKYVAS